MKKKLLAARIVFVCVAVCAVAADLATKAAFFDPRAVQTGESRYTIIEGCFYVTSAANEGGVFGVMQGSTWTLVGMALLALLAVVVMLLKMDGKQMWMHVALGLVLGGALGNLYDRILYASPDGRHYVRDFLDLHVAKWNFHYPVFNGADVFICVGAIMIFLRVLVGGPLWEKSDRPAKARVEGKKAR